MNKVLNLIEICVEYDDMNVSNYKSHSQSLVNKLLLLYTIDRTTNDTQSHLQIIQKVPLMVQSRLMKRNIISFMYNFFMYDNGPISKDIYNDTDYLTNRRIIIKNKDVNSEHTKIHLTQYGQEILYNCMDLIDENNDIKKEIDKWCLEFKDKTFSQVREIVYQNEISGLKISEFERNKDVFVDYDISNMSRFMITDEWYETLIFMFTTNQNHFNAMKTGIPFEIAI